MGKILGSRKVFEEIHLRKMEDLPLVIISDILSRLSVEVIMRCRCVCKTWYNLTMEPDFLNSQQHRGTQHPEYLLLQTDLETKKGNISNALYLIKKRSGNKWVCKEIELQVKHMRVKASCNGLLLLFPPIELNPIYIYNPITKDHLNLPELGLNLMEEFTAGFGFDQVKNIYKVVLQYEMLGKSYGEILTVGENTWRKLHFLHLHLMHCPPLFFNGALHWVISKAYDWDQKIVALNISNDRFEIIKFPPPRSGLDISKEMFQPYRRLLSKYQVPTVAKLMSLGGSLSLVSERLYSPPSVYIWQIFGSECDGRWIYKYNFGLSYEDQLMKCEVLGMLRDGCFLARALGPFYGTNSQVDDIIYPSIALYNPEKSESHILDLPGVPTSTEAFPFVPSLISPSTFNSKFKCT